MAVSPILLLDDDAEFRALAAEKLTAAGFYPAETATIADAEERVLRGSIRFQALILDVGLPDGDGCNLCARLRALDQHMPVLMLTGSDSDDDVVRGLQAGANDYLAKPLRPAELVARLRARLRQHENSMDAVFDLGPWQFYPAKKLLRNAKGVKTWLTEKEVNLLRHLVHLGGYASKSSLLADVWGYNPSVSTHTLETHIYRLRQKIEANPHNAQLLVATGGGYRLDLAG